MSKTSKNNYYVERKEVVDTATGEIGLVETTKRYKIAIESEPFYMVFINSIAPIFKLSNATTKNILAWMCSNASFNTGQISISSQDRQQLMQTFNIHNSQISKALKELTEKNIISGSRGTYIINPQIIWKGDLKTRNALLDVKEIQIAFNLNLEDTKLQEK